MAPPTVLGHRPAVAVQPPARMGLQHWSDLTDFAAMFIVKMALNDNFLPRGDL